MEPTIKRLIMYSGKGLNKPVRGVGQIRIGIKNRNTIDYLKQTDKLDLRVA